MKILLCFIMAMSFSANADDNIKLKLEKQQKVQTLAIKIITTPKNEGAAIGRNLPKIYQHIVENGGVVSAPPFVRYFKYTQTQVVIEVGFESNSEIPGSGKIYKSFLPETMAVVSIHQGPYHEVGPHYEAIESWIEEHGKEKNGPSWERSLNDPRTTTPDKYLSKVVVPVK